MTPATRTAPPRPWYVAASPDGEFIESSTDLSHLLRILTDEIMDPDGAEDVIVVAGRLVVAVVRGEDLSVVHVRG
jgi:hypothetical protein